ncbi:MAG TPA: protein kinase [Planctomycetota bacterium]|nr:protein kinase [Planctomycetota bacterium]
MVTAQDKALATLCVERGLLDDDAIERARLKHAEALESGTARPLGQLLVDGGFLNPRLASDLLRELALSTYRCNKCGRTWTYEALAALARYRCDTCDERLQRLIRTPTGRFAAVPMRPEATEVMPRGMGRGSSVSRLELAPREIVPASAPPVVVAAPEDQEVKPGKKIGPYEVVSELGRGAMGIVYLAKRPGLERLFAIKVLMGGMLADKEAVERFRREAALASRVQHPAIVGVCDVGEVTGLHYYVMEYCPGRTLKSVLQEKRKLPIRDAIQLVAKIARGIAAAHALGIVHRDMKPANIIIEAKNGEPRIMDFGLARDAQAADTGVTRTGDIIGTPSYSAPEQLTGRKNVDARVDVYALGVVLYELISGFRPFQADSVAHLAAIVLTEEARPLRELEPNTPPAIEAVVAKAMARQAADRYPTAAELATDLERYLAGRTISARPESRAARFWRTKRTVLTLTGVLLVAILAAVTMGWLAVRTTRSNELKKHMAALADLERRAAVGEPFEVLGKEIGELSSKVPADARPAVDVAWAKVLHRRARPRRALALAEANLDAPGKDGLEAKRIVADILLGAKKTAEVPRAQALLGELAKAEAPFADWAALRRAVADQSATPTDARDHAAGGSDEASLRLVATVFTRDQNDMKATETLTRIVGNIAPDDANAHLALAALTRKNKPLADLRAGAEADAARKHVDAFVLYAGEEVESSAEGLFQRAVSELGAKEYARMVADLDAAIALGVDTADAHALRAWIPDAAGLKSLARANALDAVRTSNLAPLPDDIFVLAQVVGPQVSKRIAAIVAKAQEPAREALGRALRASAGGEATDKTKALYAEAGKLAPTCPVVARERARFLVSRCKVAEARDALDAAKRLGAPEVELALLELQLDTRVLSLERARAIVDALPASGAPEAVGTLATALLQSEEDIDRQAVLPARRAVEQNPEEPAAHRVLAQVLAASATEDSDAEEAVMEARTALALGGRLDEENELALLTAHWRAIFARGPRGSGGRGGGGGHGGEAFRMWMAPFVERYDNLMASQPSARIAYWMGMNTLSASMRGFRAAERILNEAGAAARKDFDRAREIDEHCALGSAGTGFLEALMNDILDQVGRANFTKVRSNWQEARMIDPAWRMPKGWKRMVPQEIFDEFGAAPH